MTSLSEIRRTFLDFFAEDGHEVVQSAPLVPQNDPTLLFVNAGMVPFKNVFTGAEHRATPRAASSQKCVRAGGKHNDLDNVGFTARHHTFFEMLGNFSFGDYFKAHAIELAWSLVTGPYALPKDRLTVTVFAEDDEAFDLWRKIAGLPEERIIRIATSDNFWSMGDTGPCGPCSEIFFDHGDHIPGGPPGSPDEDGDRFVEIWNLVFMQFDQTAEGRVDLPRPSIDTGMGLERIGAVLQGTHDNYDTDVFKRLIGASVEASGAAADGAAGSSHRVIADHLRASGFLIADGVLPSNEGRGYVLRRIMRRAMRHAHLIGSKDPLMWRLVPELVSTMGEAYPELGRAEALISETLKLEEERFRQMLERGLKILDEAAEGLATGAKLPGEIAFKLYDTYGFPVDLTEDHLRQRAIAVDMPAFEAAMERQRAEARANWSGSGQAATDAVWFPIHEQFGASDFLGYETTSSEGTLQAIVKDGTRVEVLEPGEEAILVFDRTPFYGESGGQIGDTGTATTEAGARFAVGDTQKALGDLHIHRGTLEAGALSVGERVRLEVDAGRRDRIRANHSATHLLHEALRRVLGPHVTQKGSQVAEDRLRFDFSHSKALTGEEIRRIDAEVNALIRANEAVSTRVMAPDAAIEAGALALFGEKYGDEVRVLSMGPSAAEAGRDAFSVELCGGTHVARLGDIALFKTVSEGAVGSGVRRIEAVTGEAARTHYETQEDVARTAAALLKVTPGELPGRLETLVSERRQLERELTDAKKALALGGGGGSAGAGEGDAQDIGGLKVLARLVDGVAPKDLRGLVDEAKKQLGSGVVAFVSTENGKAALVVGVTEDLTGRVSAVDLVRVGAAEVGGKGGGGRPDLAQAGGPDAGNADAALKAITGQIETLAGAA